jgi:zinc protease
MSWQDGSRHRLRLVPLGLVCGLALASAAAAQKITPPEIRYEKQVLPNGLNLILHEDHALPVVAVNLWYHVGSKNETVGRTGFAHLFEHMMFQGSQHHDTDFFYALDAVGSTDRNGTTNNDRTNYFENVPTNALEQVLWLEADRMGWLLPSMTQERLANQIEVVKNERRQGVDNQPYGLVDERMYAALYPNNHPYNWDVIGSMADLTAASKQDVEDFFKRYYGPNNCTLVIAGDIEPTKTKALVEKYFGSIPPVPPVYRMETWIPELKQEVRLQMEDRVPLPRLYVAWHAPAVYTPGEADLEVLDGILSEGKTSRLYKRLVYDLQIAQDVNAYVDEREIGSLFYVTVTAKQGHTLDEIEPIVFEEVEKVRNTPPSADEVDRVRTRILSDIVRGLQRIGGFGGVSDRLARYNTYIGDPGYLAKEFAEYEQITPKSVQAAAQRWLHAGRCVMRVDPYPGVKADPEVAGLDRAHSPATGPAPEMVLPKLQRRKLGNGLEVVLAEVHRTPLVQMQMLVHGGWSADQKGRYGTASFTSRLIDEGTKTRSALQISEELMRLGATFNTLSALDYSGLGMNALKVRLDPAMALFADVLLNPSFPQEEIDRQRKQVIGQIMQEKKQPVQMGLRILPTLVYGSNHPYGQPLTGSGTEEVVQSLTAKDLEAFHSTWFKPNNSTLVVVGDVTLEEIVPKIEKVFGKWATGQVPQITLPTVEQPKATTVYIVDKPDAAQSVLLAAHLLPPKSDPTMVPFDVLNTILGGVFTSRINMNLREDKGYTYGANTNPIEAKGQEMWLAFSQVRTDVTKESIFELMKELRDIRGTRPVTAAELQRVQDNLVLRMPGRYESLNAVANFITQKEIFGLPEDYLSTYPQKVRGTTIQSVTELAKQRVLPDNLAFVVVGDRKVIEPKIESLKLGPIEYLDADGRPLTTSAAQR